MNPDCGEDENVLGRPLGRALGRIGRRRRGVGLAVVRRHGCRSPVIRHDDVRIGVLARGLVCSSVGRDLVRGSRRARVQRPLQDHMQHGAIVVGQPSKKLDALVRRGVAGQLQNFFCASPTPVGKPVRGRDALIEIRGERTMPRSGNRLAVQHLHEEFEQFPPVPSALTDLCSQADGGNRPAERVSTLSRLPRRRQPRAFGVSVGTNTVVVWRVHGGDSATSAGVIASVDVDQHTEARS